MVKTEVDRGVVGNEWYLSVSWWLIRQSLYHFARHACTGSVHIRPNTILNHLVAQLTRETKTSTTLYADKIRRIFVDPLRDKAKHQKSRKELDNRTLNHFPLCSQDRSRQAVRPVAGALSHKTFLPLLQDVARCRSAEWHCGELRACPQEIAGSAIL